VRAKVLTDPSLTEHAGRFVWLSINTEEERNAAFLDRYAIEGLPTFFVLDPATETAALKWLGSATAPQFVRLFEEGEHAVRTGGGTAAGPEDLLAAADRRFAAGQAAEAAEGYRAALTAGGPDWPRRPRALESLVNALAAAEQWEACATLARQEAPALPRGPSFANVAAIGLDCTGHGPEEAPWKADAQRVLDPLVEEALSLPEVLADDRSSLYALLADRLQTRGDEAGAKALAGRWLAFLEAEAEAAPTVEARAAFDSHRVSAAFLLGEPERALPALIASERDLPRDYNPAARQALVYREMGRYENAIAASQRALDKAYGPRKLRIYDVLADTQVKKGDADAARATVEEALRFADSLPEAQRPRQLLQALREKLEPS
jgi:tetratricopeptide (TPR) repeat protein